MANDGYTQQALAADMNFRKRVRAQMSSVAWQVVNEPTSTPNHDARERYARQVIRNLDGETGAILPSFVMRPNVFNFETTYVFDFLDAVGHVASASGDPDIASQLATDWDVMAAAAGYTAGGVGPAMFIPPPAA